MIEAVAVVVAIIVIVAVYFAIVRVTRGLAERDRGVLAMLWCSLDPRLKSRTAWEDNTTQTLRLLMMVMIIFGVLIAVWAFGASVMRTVWLLDSQSGPAWPGGVADHVWDWRSLLFAVFEIVRGVAGSLVLCAAGGILGAGFGFLFGLPRQPPDTAAEIPARAADKDGGKSSGRWRLNTNLIRIGDWLTNGIVAIALVELKPALQSFGDQTGILATWLFGGRHGSFAVIPAAIGGAAVFGFLFSNLYTQLIVSGLLAEADEGLRTGLPGKDARATLAHIKSTREGLVPRISRSKLTPEPQDQPTLEETEAALEYMAISFDDLTSRSDTPRDTVLNWARARAVLNDYRDAVKGYIYLLGNKGDG